MLKCTCLMHIIRTLGLTGNSEENTGDTEENTGSTKKNTGSNNDKNNSIKLILHTYIHVMPSVNPLLKFGIQVMVFQLKAEKF